MSRRYRVIHGTDETIADLAADGLVEIDGQSYRVSGAGPGRYRVTGPDGLDVHVAQRDLSHAADRAVDRGFLSGHLGDLPGATTDQGRRGRDAGYGQTDAGRGRPPGINTQHWMPPARDGRG